MLFRFALIIFPATMNTLSAGEDVVTIVNNFIVISVGFGKADL